MKALAHEVLPTIADMTLTPDGTLRLDMRVNLEAFLAGIDLDAVADTDADPAAADYDALRALPGEALLARLPEIVAAWNALPLSDAGGPLSEPGYTKCRSSCGTWATRRFSNSPKRFRKLLWKNSTFRLNRKFGLFR